MLWAQSKTNAAIRLERLWDDVAKQNELDKLCAYPARIFPGGKDDVLSSSEQNSSPLVPGIAR